MHVSHQGCLTGPLRTSSLSLSSRSITTSASCRRRWAPAAAAATAALMLLAGTPPLQPGSRGETCGVGGWGVASAG